MTHNTLSPAVEMETLAQHCHHLRLTRVGQTLSTLLEQAAQQEPDAALLCEPEP